MADSCFVTVWGLATLLSLPMVPHATSQTTAIVRACPVTQCRPEHQWSWLYLPLWNSARVPLPWSLHTEPGLWHHVLGCQSAERDCPVRSPAAASPYLSLSRASTGSGVLTPALIRLTPHAVTSPSPARPSDPVLHRGWFNCCKWNPCSTEVQ